MGVFIQIDYTDTEGTPFKIEFSDTTYSGDIEQVQGKAVLSRPKVKTMDMLRGSKLDIQLEADTTSTYYTRLIETVGDKKIVVVLYKDGDVIFNGFLKPDGIYESFVTDFWVINVQAIDGLGLLENIKFLNEDGAPYQGSMNELQLLGRCLELTGQSMYFKIYNFNLYFTIDEDAPTTGTKAIKDTYVNADRYIKEDNSSSVFTVKEVLESILKKYGAFICQQDGYWHIVRIIDYFKDDEIAYWIFDLNGDSVGEVSYLTDPRTELGSDINDFNPCHATGNQSKFYKAALGAYKAIYKYGLVKSILENRKIYFNDEVGDIDGWIVETSLSHFNFVLKPAIAGWVSGYYEAQMLPTTSTTKALSYDYTSYDNDVSDADTLKVVFVAGVKLDFDAVGLYYQKARVTLKGDSGSDYYLNKSGEWTLSNTKFKLYNFKFIWGKDTEFTQTTTITSNGLPEDGTVTVEIWRPVYGGTDNGSYTVIKSVNITGVMSDIKGESFTSRRLDNVTAVVDNEDNIYVGDNEADLYIGAIEDSSGENTIRWSKTISGVIDSSKQYPILNWMSRDRLTISGGNATTFKGGISGYLPYLGVLSIDNVEGIFMTTEWSYDTAENKIEAEHQRIFTDDIYSDVTVDFNLEDENVIKPAIE